MDYCLEVMMQYDVCPTSSGLVVARAERRLVSNLSTGV